MAEPVRLSKLMSERGLCSRREADEYIEKGLVFVDGQKISVLGTRVDPGCEIRLAGAARASQELRVKGLAPAGRLDIDSTGLLVLTQDGRIAKQLIGDDSEVEKEYLVRVQGQLSEQGLKLLNHGLELDGRKLRPARVAWQNEDQLRFILKEGRKRQIRRMCELVGLKVVGLKRVRIGQVCLGDLPLGQWRYLKAGERF
jgi:23S rRNA pseudouridine2604 synthase